ncbi:MAG TPA: aspartate--tRNA(Asn) ligase [Candidatus Obscuribacterales bacterium]
MSLFLREEHEMSVEEITADELASHVGKRARLKGHIQALRDLGNLVFLVLRDSHSTVQMVAEHPQIVAIARQAEPESAVIAEGTIEEKPNKKGEQEVRLTSLTVLSSPQEPMPIEIGKQNKIDNLSLSTTLDYRPLTLRNPKIRAIFKIEAEMAAAFREHLSARGFTEIHSPKVVSTGTEGGAQLFRLDYFGKPAFLAQSPQFYKQIMVGAFERVFEVGPVYRAEEHDTTRHLNEYVSMDVEMGFIANERELMHLLTDLIKHIFERVKERCQKELSMHGAVVPEINKIPAITLADAVDLINEQSRKGRKGAEKTDLDPEGERVLCEYFYEKEGSDLVFVTGYPRSARPFYAMPLETQSEQSTRSFDLLFRGLEITTGGQRIHEYQMLVQSIRSRGLDPDSFADYLQCFKYGMPPHGGFAIGLERLAKQLLGLKTVKLAALFPRDINRLTP